MNISVEAAELLGKAFGRIAWENGATWHNQLLGDCCDCVEIEESKMYAGLMEELGVHTIKGTENNPAYDRLHYVMYMTARALASKHGHREVK